MTSFKLPDLGEGLEEAEIVHWHVSVGDPIAADQPLVSVETDKAVVEVPSPMSGRIVSLMGKPGDIVKVGAVLAEIEPTEKRDIETIVGMLEPAKEASRTSSPPPAAREHKGPRAKAAPAVRALAQELGIDISSVRGTGPVGAIIREDVESVAKLEAQRAKVLEAGFEPLRGVRRTMARAMTRAGRSVVPATVTEEANVSHWPHDVEVTLLAVETVVTAAKAEPALNASFDETHEARRLNENIDIGIAVDTSDGLIVPVLRTGKFNGRDSLRAELKRLIEAAHARSLARDEMKDPTITLSNFGGLGGLYASLVVLPPQVAILGVGRIKEWMGPGREVFSRSLPLSLTFDHRAVTGGEAARFLASVKAALESAK
ncbi:MAG: dihydrolipoamide acetyltransferase family protein [Alphaproteobacteria bacterium]